MLKTIWMAFSVLCLIAISSVTVYYFSIFRPKKIEEEYLFETTAYFSDIRGLYKEASLRLNGKQVGRVNSMHLEGDRVRVKIALTEEFPLYLNYNLTLNPLNLFGGFYIELEPGDREWPKLSNSLKGQTLYGKSIGDPFTTLGFLLDENRKNIRLIVENLRETSEKLLEKRGTLGKILLDEQAYDLLLSLMGDSKKLISDMKLWKELGYHDEKRSEWTRSVIPITRKALP